MAAGTVTVQTWLVDLDAPAPVADRLARVLDAEERVHAAARRASAARRYSVAHGARREILGRVLDVDPASLRIEAGRFGAPELRDHPDVTTSLSHSGSVALLAVARGARVGIDLEEVRPRPRLDELARRVLSAGELDAWLALPGDRRLRGFLEAWTAKEAFLKATGEGIRRPLASVPASLPDGWVRATPDAGPAHVTCLAVEAAACVVDEHRYTPEP